MFASNLFSRGTVGLGEVIEALNDPEKAPNFAQRVNELINGEEGTNERVRKNVAHILSIYDTAAAHRVRTKS